jgi:hypothetical protein
LSGLFLYFIFFLFLFCNYVFNWQSFKNKANGPSILINVLFLLFNSIEIFSKYFNGLNDCEWQRGKVVTHVMTSTSNLRIVIRVFNPVRDKPVRNFTLFGTGWLQERILELFNKPIASNAIELELIS